MTAPRLPCPHCPAVRPLDEYVADILHQALTAEGGGVPSTESRRFAQAIAILPADASAYKGRARACLGCGMLCEALADAATAVALDATDCEAVAVRAEVKLAMGQHQVGERREAERGLQTQIPPQMMFRPHVHRWGQ